jgi:hypothetical protein
VWVLSRRRSVETKCGGVGSATQRCTNRHVTASAVTAVTAIELGVSVIEGAVRRGSGATTGGRGVSGAGLHRLCYLDFF